MRGGGSSKDPSEGIRQVLGKHTKILLKVAVKLEKGGDKTDNRIVVVTGHRLYIMTNKVRRSPSDTRVFHICINKC